MQRHACRNFVGEDIEGTVGIKLRTRERCIPRQVGDVLQVDTCLRVSRAQVMSSKQAMSLRANISDRENRVLEQLPLNTEVVLRGVLRPEIWLQLAKQHDRAKSGPVN